MLLELASTHARESAAGTTKVGERNNLIVDSAAPGRTQRASLVGSCSTQSRVGSSRRHSMNRVEARAPAEGREKRTSTCITKSTSHDMSHDCMCIHQKHHSLSALWRFLWRKNSQGLVTLLLPVKKQIFLFYSEHLLKRKGGGRRYYSKEHHINILFSTQNIEHRLYAY